MTLKIKKGDSIKISTLRNIVSGKVLNAEYYFGLWDIEIGDTNLPNGYSHWKQELDGGKIIELNGKEVV